MPWQLEKKEKRKKIGTPNMAPSHAHTYIHKRDMLIASSIHWQTPWLFMYTTEKEEDITAHVREALRERGKGG